MFRHWLATNKIVCHTIYSKLLHFKISQTICRFTSDSYSSRPKRFSRVCCCYLTINFIPIEFLSLQLIFFFLLSPPFEFFLASIILDMKIVCSCMSCNIVIPLSACLFYHSSKQLYFSFAKIYIPPPGLCINNLNASCWNAYINMTNFMYIVMTLWLVGVYLKQVHENFLKNV